MDSMRQKQNVLAVLRKEIYTEHTRVVGATSDDMIVMQMARDIDHTRVVGATSDSMIVTQMAISDDMIVMQVARESACAATP